MGVKQSKRDPKEKITTTSLRLPEKKLKKLRQIALKEGKSMNVILEDLITEFMESYPKK